jgi:hypothetical protein
MTVPPDVVVPEGVRPSTPPPPFGKGWRFIPAATITDGPLLMRAGQWVRNCRGCGYDQGAPQFEVDSAHDDPWCNKCCTVRDRVLEAQRAVLTFPGAKAGHASFVLAAILTGDHNSPVVRRQARYAEGVRDLRAVLAKGRDKG